MSFRCTIILLLFFLVSFQHNATRCYEGNKKFTASDAIKDLKEVTVLIMLPLLKLDMVQTIGVESRI